MVRLSWFASLIVLGMATALLHGHHPNGGTVNADISRNTDGAFRDGLFLGKRAAESGAAPNAPIGRWATKADRASFTAGYLRGYEEVLTNRAAR
jgi:hypothetical protein